MITLGTAIVLAVLCMALVALCEQAKDWKH